MAPILGGLALDGLVRAGMSWRAAFFIMIAMSALVFASAIARFRSMSTELFGDSLFDYVYLHVSRIADFIAKEERQTGEHPRA